MILAKPIIANRYWILKKDDQKIGEVQATDSEVTVKINNQIQRFRTIRKATRDANIEFEPAPRVQTRATNNVYGYAVSGRVYNPVWDVKHKLPLYTKDSKSRSWYAAGWYSIKQHQNWTVTKNPKFIMLQRYKYQGPFHTQEQAHESVS